MTDVFGWLRKVWPNVNRIKKYMKITAAKTLHGVVKKMVVSTTIVEDP